MMFACGLKRTHIQLLIQTSQIDPEEHPPLDPELDPASDLLAEHPEPEPVPEASWSLEGFDFDSFFQLQ